MFKHPFSIMFASQLNCRCESKCSVCLTCPIPRPGVAAELQCVRGEDPGGRPPDQRPVLPRGLLHLHQLRGRAQRDLLHPGGGHLPPPTGLIVHDAGAQGGHQCPACWEAGLERCRHCGLAIKERIVRALDSAWHPACFRCRHVTLCHTMSHCHTMLILSYYVTLLRHVARQVRAV